MAAKWTKYNKTLHFDTLSFYALGERAVSHITKNHCVLYIHNDL